jgi:hypothetical protein
MIESTAIVVVRIRIETLIADAIRTGIGRVRPGTGEKGLMMLAPDTAGGT